MKIREMTIGDYETVMSLLNSTIGVRLRDADSCEATLRYLERNPGLSFVALMEDRIVGCVMCGHDGRRGYLQHLAVDAHLRRKGIGSALVETCLSKLESLGIFKTHIDVLVENQTAIEYWSRRNWKKRDDIYRFSIVRSANQNA